MRGFCRTQPQVGLPDDPSEAGPPLAVRRPVDSRRPYLIRFRCPRWRPARTRRADTLPTTGIKTRLLPQVPAPAPAPSHPAEAAEWRQLTSRHAAEAQHQKANQAAALERRRAEWKRYREAAAADPGARSRPRTPSCAT